MPSAEGVTNLFFGLLLGVNGRPFSTQRLRVPSGRNTGSQLLGRLDSQAHTPCFVFVLVLDFACFLLLNS